MKKSILVIAIAALGFTTASAQESVMFGVKGGVNFADITGDDFGDAESRTSFNLGLVGEIPLSNKVSIQPEVLYSGQGFDVVERDQDNVFDTDGNIEYQLDYIQVPVLAKFYLVDGLSLQAGPSFNFKVSEEIDYKPLEDGGDVDFDEAEDFEFGVASGLEYKFNNGFFIQGRYNYGFTDLIKDRDIHNSVFQAGIGFMF
ncbi:PorT family protein [Gillisia sp. M10.2A]|uniref:PorT family protein n=1 Tax=Gillisia lutea TaxID=2909668 RepID=A0ABS9EIW8_9FLAO|nr:porin family protein [Gillisia lutea]MCF4102803.1 PorT family protein [Gillisia lutea]